METMKKFASIQDWIKNKPAEQEMTRVLEFINKNEYHKVIEMLNIKINSEFVQKENCLICHEDHNEIIKMPCGHSCCLRSMLEFFTVGKIHTKKCVYCQKEFQWMECTSVHYIIQD